MFCFGYPSNSEITLHIHRNGLDLLNKLAHHFLYFSFKFSFPFLHDLGPFYYISHHRWHNVANF